MTRCPPERVIIVALGPPGTLATFERRFAEAFGNARRTAARAALAGARGLAATALSVRTQRRQDHLFRPARQAARGAAPCSPHVVGCHSVTVPAVSRFAAGRVSDGVCEARSSLGGETEPDDGGAARALWRLVRTPSFLHGTHTQGPLVSGVLLAGCSDLLGWIDAVRLALLDDTAFQARLKIDSVAQDART